MPSISRATVLLVALAACGGDGRHLGPEPATCAGRWRTLLSPKQTTGLDLPQSLVTATTGAYYRALDQPTMFVAPNGRPAVPLVSVPATAFHLWTAGDDLVFMTYPDEQHDAQVSVLPAGAAEPRVVTSVPFWPRSRSPFAAVQNGVGAVVDGTLTFVFMSGSTEPLQRWRLELATGANELKPLAGDADRSDFVTAHQMLASGDLLFAWGLEGFTLPKTGDGPIAELPKQRPYLWLIGAASDGRLLWYANTDDDDQAALGVSTITRPAPIRSAPFGVPAGFYPEQALDDGAGGWFIVGAERLADGVPHLSVFRADAAAKLTRLACDPQVKRFAQRVAANAEGVYVAASWLGSDAYTQLAFVPRGP
jgi:hypothetical protein